MKTISTSLWMVCLLFGATIPALRADTPPKTESPAAPRAGQEVSRGTAVVYPVIFDKSGTKAAQATAVLALRDALQTAGYTLISQTVARNAWQHLDLALPTEITSVPTDDLVRFGQFVHADYVVSAAFHYHSRSIWVDIGPKTVSTVTTDLIIVDVNQNKPVYSKRGVTARSDTRGKMTDLVPFMMFSLPFQAIVSGGPKTAHEQRAAELAVAAALKVWVEPDQISANKAQP